MKVASFNVNSLRVRLEIILDWLQQQQPDILAVQETKVQDTDFPIEAFEETPYNCIYKGQKSYNGVAIFSKAQPSDIVYGFENEPKDQSRLIKAKINGITIVNTYIPQGYLPESEKFAYKLNWFKRLQKYFYDKFSRNEPVLWVGDFNVAPEPIDVYDPEGLSGHVCFRPEVRKALKQIMKWGFTDIFRKHCQEPGQYTFWDYRARNTFKRNLGWRLDHIMATEPLAGVSIACYIDKGPRALKRPSDHTPVIAEFNW
jgi:exodeoxyribonuclease-3